MTALATVEVLDGEIVDREALLDSIAEYATWLQEAERLVQSKSLEKAADVWALYSEGSWIEEWQAESPATKDFLGNIDRGSRERFAKWLEEAETRRGKPTLAPSTVRQLLNAHEVVSVLPSSSQRAVRATGVSEDAVRPLVRLKKAKLEDHIPEVWSAAIRLADETKAERVTQQHVRQAISEFMSTLTPELQRQAINTPRAVTLRTKAQSYVDDLWKTGNKTECKKFYDWFVEFMRAQHGEDAA